MAHVSVAGAREKRVTAAVAEVQVEFLGRDDPRWLAGGRWLAATLAESVKDPERRSSTRTLGTLTEQGFLWASLLRRTCAPFASSPGSKARVKNLARRCLTHTHTEPETPRDSEGFSESLDWYMLTNASDEGVAPTCYPIHGRPRYVSEV